MPRLKVVIAIEPYIGGTREHILQICRGLDKTKFDIVLIVSPLREPSLEGELLALRDIGITLRLLPMRRAISPLADLKAFIALRRILKAERPDILHTHSSKAGILGRLAGRTFARSLVHTPHIFAFEWERGPRKLLYWALEWLMARWTDRIIAIASYQTRLYPRKLSLDQSRVVLIPNGVDPESLQSSKPREETRRELGLSPDDFAICSAGRLCPQKGFDILVRAAELVIPVWPNARFLLFGTGELEAELKGLAAALRLGDRFRFCGQRENMSDLYPAMDAYVLSSRWEGLPYVVLEAMHCGLPVVSTALPGIRDLIEHERTGLLAEDVHWEPLAREILRLRDSTLCRHLAEAARAKVAAGFTSKECLQSLGRLYQSLGS